MGLTIKRYHEIMGDVVSQFETIGVSGTHGKTSTSSMIKHVLENTVGCNYFIGAGDGKATRDNKYYVVESDEFNRHFKAYHPVYSIITNIEEEHMEIYKDIDDKEISLTPKEYDLLVYFINNKGIALSREQLLNNIWNYDFYGNDRTIDTHIKMLRNNLKQYRDLIVTIRRMGYKFEIKD